MDKRYFSIVEREYLERSLNLGFKNKQIAETLKVSVRTIQYELKKNCVNNKYDAKLAQQMVEDRYKKRKRSVKITQEIAKIIEDKIRIDLLSPEQIVGRFSEEIGIKSFKTIYNYINKFMTHLRNKLRRKGRRTRKQEARGKISIPEANLIHNRPDFINDRLESGHWEIDTMIGAKGKDKNCLLTLVDRVTRFCIIAVLPNKKSSTVNLALSRLIIELSLKGRAVKSITSDRGKEFADLTYFENFGISIYYADAYSSYQRGTNENTNGLLREFFAKGSSFAGVSVDYVNYVLGLLNNRPRKILGFLTPNEVY